MEGAAFPQLAATFVLNLAFAILAGASVVAWWLRSHDWAGRPALPVPALVAAVAAVALTADGAGFWLAAARMAEVPLGEAWPAVRSMAADTHFGRVWVLGMGALAVVLASASLPVRAGGGLRLAALLVFAVSRSLGGHAAAEGDLSLALGVDVLHFILIGLWLGEVAMALLLLRGPAQREAMAFVEHVSSTATSVLVGIFATGALNTWRMVAPLAGTLGSPYVTVLLLKVGLVLLAAALGGINRFVVMPQMRTPAIAFGVSRGRFRTVLGIESVVLAAALAAAAVLSSTQPPHAG
ncbi:copper resistance protein CopD [Massilia arenosa]|uniref:Copper resistance protein CopD n=1 Tax=Zemynaea arenosa TaxID=2561931 RepID=A0A4Y9RZY9_9BURK|nr:CopD family protein [Massilia arenosa]TFW13346.1 copper resistance protein CopD [Massilia arenosa]